MNTAFCQHAVLPDSRARPSWPFRLQTLGHPSCRFITLPLSATGFLGL